LSGNPVFPFFFGGPSWDAERLEAVTSFLDSFGTGRSFWDYVLIPFNVYAQNARYGTMFTTIDFPGFLFPLALFYPFTRKGKGIRRLWWLTVFIFAVWTLGSQQTRFLFIIYPLTSIIVSHVLISRGELLSSPSIRRVLVLGIVGGFVAVTCLYQVGHFLEMAPYQAVFGNVSKGEYLTRTVYDYPALQYIQEILPDNARVLMVWDGQGYYCDDRCIPDPDQTRLLHLTKSQPDPTALTSELVSSGVTHVLVDTEGLAFFQFHDLDGRHRQASDYFLNEFVPECAEKVYSDDAIIIFELTCEARELKYP
jgi:hypothetical protein